MKIKRVGCPVLSKWKKCFNKEEIINFEMLGEISGGPNINIELAMGGGGVSDLHKSIFSRMVGMNAS